MSAPKLKQCRLCAERKHDAQILDLNTHHELFKQIKHKLTSLNIGDIKFSFKDPLTKHVCLPCNNSLNSAHDFVLKVRQSQTKLEEMRINFINAVVSDFFKSDEISDSEFDSHLSPTKSDTSKGIDDILQVTAGTDIDEFQHENVTLHADNVVKLEDRLSENTFATTWSEYSWTCRFCDEIFIDKDALREHGLSEHDECCALRCADCELNFSEFNEFIDHVRTHRDDLRHYCEYCNLKLEPDTVSTHIAEHTGHPFRCIKCAQMFDDEENLLKHTTNLKSSKRNVTRRHKKRKRLVKLKDESWNGYPWTCQLCETRFGDVTSLRTHVKVTHGKCFAIKCIDCEDVMDSYRGFITHARKHRVYLKRHCHYCNHKFEKNQKRADHIATHFTQSSRLCEGCGEILADIEKYQKHIATYNPPAPRDKLWTVRDRPICIDDLKCDTCEKVFKNVYLLREHKTLHTVRDKNYTCDRCGKPYYTEAALQSHQQTHEESRPVVCEICRKGFRHVYELRQHVTTHTGDKPYQCTICQRPFRLNKQLVSHMRLHTNEMPFKCQYCEKRFRHKNVLKEHENQHTGARPYRCKECGMGYASWKSCEKHTRSKHGTTMCKSAWTPYGKLPIDPSTGKPKEVKDIEKCKEWAEQLLATKRVRKAGKVTDKN